MLFVQASLLERVVDIIAGTSAGPPDDVGKAIRFGLRDRAVFHLLGEFGEQLRVEAIEIHG
jgi:hypothetical protein